jgi:hypothetical protein
LYEAYTSAPVYCRRGEKERQVAVEDYGPRLLKFAFVLDAYEVTIPSMQSHFEVQLPVLRAYALWTCEVVLSS